MAEQSFRLRVNGAPVEIHAAGDTPLLYVLQDDLALKGPRFGCGLAQCGACSVLVDGRETRACVTPLSAVAGRDITTLEGLPAWYATRRQLPATPDLHPVQRALLEGEVPQCGYCMNGIVIKAAELLDQEPHPDEQRIRNALDGHLCRCGTYPGILRAILRTSRQP